MTFVSLEQPFIHLMYSPFHTNLLRKQPECIFVGNKAFSALKEHHGQQGVFVTEAIATMFIMYLESVPLPDLTLTLPDNNKISIFIFIRLFLMHNPPWQTPLTVSLSGVRYPLDLSIAHLESQAHIFLYPQKIQAGVKIIAIFIVTRWHASLVWSTQRQKV